MFVLFADISFPKKPEKIIGFQKQCVRFDSGNLNSHSGMLNTDSGKSRKVFSLKSESAFNLNQNRCSDWIRMGVQDEPEYAVASARLVRRLVHRQSEQCAKFFLDINDGIGMGQFMA
jgi:hypothetical protein